jgi:hypothetical protein
MENNPDGENGVVISKKTGNRAFSTSLGVCESPPLVRNQPLKTYRDA